MRELFRTEEAFDYLKSLTIGLYDYEGLPMLNSNGKYAEYTVLLTERYIDKNYHSLIANEEKIYHFFYLSLLKRFCCDDAIVIHNLVFRKSSLVIISSELFGVCNILKSRRKL